MKTKKNISKRKNINKRKNITKINNKLPIGLSNINKLFIQKAYQKIIFCASISI